MFSFFGCLRFRYYEIWHQIDMYAVTDITEEHAYVFRVQDFQKERLDSYLWYKYLVEIRRSFTGP